MKVRVIDEDGYLPALFGLGLSYGLTSDMDYGELEWSASDYVNDLYERLKRLTDKLSNRDGGHNKFLESLTVWLDIDAPRYWWSEFDTYRVGVTKQSESTMHTLKKRKLKMDDFESPVPEEILEAFNSLLDAGEGIEVLKNALPEGFLQRRIICTNYKTLKNIIQQREGHKLPQWRFFCRETLEQVSYPWLIKEDYERI